MFNFCSVLFCFILFLAFSIYSNVWSGWKTYALEKSRNTLGKCVWLGLRALRPGVPRKQEACWMEEA